VADVGIGGLGINPGGEGDMGFHSGGRRPGGGGGSRPGELDIGVGPSRIDGRWGIPLHPEMRGGTGIFGAERPVPSRGGPAESSAGPVIESPLENSIRQQEVTHVTGSNE
jgi:hypothetical protein